MFDGVIKNAPDLDEPLSLRAACNRGAHETSFAGKTVALLQQRGRSRDGGDGGPCSPSFTSFGPKTRSRALVRIFRSHLCNLRTRDGGKAGGESEILAVTALGGIGCLKQLETLDLVGYGGGVQSILPLKSHPTLRRIVIEGAPTDPEVLLTLPALKEVEFKHLPAKVASELRRRGVHVSMPKLRQAKRRAK